MRVVLLGVGVVLGTLYGAGALYFWRHERTAQSLEAARSLSPQELEHPEATLALIRDRMEHQDFSPLVAELVEISRKQVPSFYQPPAYEATYHATRLEAPARTDECYRSALARFPANGRLHLDYARWLLVWTSTLSGVDGTRDEAEEHVRVALRLEPNLTRDALETIRQNGVPPDRWPDIVPDEIESRRLLVPALAQAGHREAAISQLRLLLARTGDAGIQRQAAYWALSWGDPELALQAVRLWKSNEVALEFEPHEPGLLEAQAYLELGAMQAAYDVFRSTLKFVGPSSSAGVELLCAMGEEYLRLSRLFLAESIFAEALGYSPSNARALLGLARVHQQRGDYVQAISFYERTLELDPENPAAMTELANVMGRGRR